MSSKEKICLHEREKHPALPRGPAEDEDEEAGRTAPPGQAKASSSSSSEEESESESDAESGESGRTSLAVAPRGCFSLTLLNDPLVQFFSNCLQRKPRTESSSIT